MKTAIVIGATSGIGREVAASLVREGWRVGIAGRRQDALAAFQAEFGADKVSTAVIDIMAPSAVTALDALIAETGAPDLFFHASGIGYQGSDIDEEKELRTIQTNCDGMVRMVAHFTNFVKAHPDVYNAAHKAQIAVITSIAGTAGLGSAAAYSASKRMQSTYLSAMTQLARMEKLPVRFTDIRPGFVDTALLDPERRYPMLLSREKASRCILKAIKRKRRICIVDWKYRALVFFWRLIPRPLWERLTFISN